MHLEALAYVGRLNETEQNVVEEMYASGVKPKKILSILKKITSDNTTVMRTIYIVKVKLYNKQLDGPLPIQFLYKRIIE